MNDAVAGQAVATEAPKAVAAEALKVTMKDGAVREFVGKRKMLKDYQTKDGVVYARFDFVNGEFREIMLNQDLILQAAGHGVVQKVGDSAAGEKNIDDMVLAVEDTIKQLEEGNWNVKREGGGFGGAGIVIRAVAELKKIPVEQVKAWVDSKIAAAKAKGESLTRQAIYTSLRNVPELKEIIRRLEDEQAAKDSKVDGGALLGELEVGTAAA